MIKDGYQEVSLTYEHGVGGGKVGVSGRLCRPVDFTLYSSEENLKFINTIGCERELGVMPAHRLLSGVFEVPIAKR